ncbi:MAG: ATP-binding cassette domain-containing protein [Saprospiraceae bacterium]|nr:ATP-binding cassette domain-containing protein [Saprospiraceae bacterium]
MIELNNVIPLPLLENGLNPCSEVFSRGGVQFEKGKNYLISAASGKGKSTLIHAIYGLRNDYQGAVVYENKNLKDLRMDDWATIRQKKMAVVFQDLRLFLHLTARENIELKRQLTAQFQISDAQFQLASTEIRNPKSEIAPPSVSDLENWAKRLGIAEYLDKTCAMLSYGQRQRVAIVRALAQPFDYLLLDEPFSHLDTENIAIATAIIKEACTQQNAGLILVSLGDKYTFKYDKILQI